MTDELTAHPGVGRCFRHEARVRLGDTTADGRARCDALARWCQDAAYDDVLDGEAAEDGAWVVRSLELRVERFPRLAEALTVQTWCDGLGRRRLWARRRTTIRGADGGHVEAVATWVHLDPASGRPRPLSERQLALWEPSTAGREVKARLSHPPVPESGGAAEPFPFRVSDVDVAGHVNNAAYWCVLEERLDAAEPLRATIEHRAAAQPGAATVARAGDMVWIAGADGEPCASIRITL